MGFECISASITIQLAITFRSHVESPHLGLAAPAYIRQSPGSSRVRRRFPRVHQSVSENVVFELPIRSHVRSWGIAPRLLKGVYLAPGS